jgi:hypothetical protein
LRGITLTGIGVRFLIAFALVCVTWNPTRYNYYEWALAQWATIPPLVVFVGIVLIIAWVVFVRATARSLGAFGIVLSVGLAASVLWILFFYDIVDTANSDALGWIVLVLFAAILAAGMSWSHLRRSWAGQADVDDVDEP